MQTITSKVLTIATAAVSTDVKDRVKTFEDACRETGIYPEELSITGTGLTDEQTKAATSLLKLSIINKALNGAWTPDFSDKNQPKYYPWFEFKKGSGFVLCYVHDDYDCTVVGARLCFKSSDIAEYAATQFSKEYNEFLLP